MELYAYCFMPSRACPERSRRVHFIFRYANEQPMELLRDFKRHTAKKVIDKNLSSCKELRKKVEKNGCHGCLNELVKKQEMLVNINFGNIITSL